MKSRMILAVLAALMVAGIAWSLEGDDGQKLNGPHETLNIIGVQNPKKVDMDAVEEEHGRGSVIFVNLSGLSKINLVVGDTFAVLDKNGTDNDGATFQMPDPDLDPYVVGEETEDTDTTSAYSIYVRPLGKPDGYAIITTCADVLTGPLADFLGATDVKVLNRAGAFGGQCSIEQVGQLVTTRTKGKTEFANVTAELTTIVLRVQILDGTGAVIDTVYVRVPIFDDMLENEYWEYDNHGLKLLQVRIYPWGTDVSENDDPALWDTL
jgi:hypothetical protein